MRLNTYSFVAQDLAFEVIRLFADDIPSDDLRNIVNTAYDTFAVPEVTPIKKLKNYDILELWHGMSIGLFFLSLVEHG